MAESLTHFTSFNSLNIIKIYSSNTDKKLSHFRNFPANMFLVDVRKKHLHCSISRPPRTAFMKDLESKFLYIPVNLPKKIFILEKLEDFIWFVWLDNFLNTHWLKIMEFYLLLFKAMLRFSRGGSRAAATCKMEHFLIIVLVMLPAMDSISVINIYDLFELKSKVYLCINS